MRKATLTIAALAAATLVLSGCGSNASTSNTTTSAAGSAPASVPASTAGGSSAGASSAGASSAGASSAGASSAGASSAGASSGASSAGASSAGASSAGASSGGSSSPGTAGGAVNGKVGVILPDTTSSTRYTLYDAPLLTAAFKTAGVDADVQNAGGDVSKFTSIAQSMLGEGVKVLIMDSIDPASGAGVEALAKKAGIQVIDYDRVNLGGSADYYVSFDNEAVGKLQGQTLVSCLDNAKMTDPQIIEMDGGTDVDNNAVLFKAGAQTVLSPLQTAGKLKVVSQNTVLGWDVTKAAPLFTQALTANGGKVDGVLAANDDIANAVIGVLKGKGLAGKVQITGQDSGVEGLQNILNGYQCMTVFKDVKKEAAAASALAISLIKNGSPDSSGLTLSDFKDPKGNRTLKAVLLPAEAITIKNVQDVVKAGALTAAKICQGIEPKCTAAGVK
ncbi:MAG: substrate-binding domain-containing protein [Actinomycetota bacterium]|nr:substrate-binding domain-containing protein [Actinomycetota bacterium]